MDHEYEVFHMGWKGQEIIIRWCPDWLGSEIAHLEILTKDSKPHLISKTGYRSHFCSREQVEEAGGAVKFVTDWMKTKDDGKPVQLSLF